MYYENMDLIDVGTVFMWALVVMMALKGWSK